MSIEQLQDGRWFVDVEPIKGKRFRKRFKTKAEAVRFESLVRQRLVQDTEWNPKPKDKRRLSELVGRWFDLHGHTLSDAARRKQVLLTLANELRDPLGRELTGNQVNELRRVQMENGVAGKTLNNRLGYLKAVFNELYQLGEIEYRNPLERVRPIKLQERALSFLSQEDISTLLKALDARDSSPHPPMIARVCLATGARWGEVEGLDPTLIRNGTVTFANTKSKRTRTIPISAELEKTLKAHLARHGRFTHCMETFRRVLRATNINAPQGQASHILRHTFASHFIMNGGNILTLQKILGHASLTMTMRYAHLSPDHLQDAVKLNPLLQSEEN
ncbi:tyrosine-type recombinase/integrase [Pseudomonas sp. BN606]|uniref:phage integrase n=1 Tax=Pseudomonas sp. BN606 TaxID=2567894 RepID=UPI00245435B7|nr:tyrosine-type recombinase/integrase [Pseudomonas sp. BN606]MDH4651418.1 integrase [Pseudomonas sp. BN606]